MSSYAQLAAFSPSGIYLGAFLGDLLQEQVSAFQTRYGPEYTDCRNVTPVSVKGRVTSAAGQISSSFAVAGAAGPFILVAAPVLAIFGAIFAHHARAVARERQVLCAAVPAARDSLTAIHDAVLNGTITPTQGKTGLDKLESDFAAAIHLIEKHCGCFPNSGCRGNAACGLRMGLHELARQMRLEFDQFAAQQAASPVAAALTTIFPKGTPGWVPWAIAAGTALLILR